MGTPLVVAAWQTVHSGTVSPAPRSRAAPLPAPRECDFKCLVCLRWRSCDKGGRCVVLQDSDARACIVLLAPVGPPTAAFCNALLPAHNAPPALRATGINTNNGVRGRGQGGGAGTRRQLSTQALNDSAAQCSQGSSWVSGLLVGVRAPRRCPLADGGVVKGRQCACAHTCKHTPILSVPHVQEHRGHTTKQPLQQEGLLPRGVSCSAPLGALGTVGTRTPTPSMSQASGAGSTHSRGGPVLGTVGEAGCVLRLQAPGTDALPAVSLGTSLPVPGENPSAHSSGGCSSGSRGGFGSQGLQRTAGAAGAAARGAAGGGAGGGSALGYSAEGGEGAGARDAVVALGGRSERFVGGGSPRHDRAGSPLSGCVLGVHAQGGVCVCASFYACLWCMSCNVCVCVCMCVNGQ